MVERKKGEIHPRYSDTIYPVDYGYVSNTKSSDGAVVDSFIGQDATKAINGIFCTVDKLKNDTEIKIVYGCTPDEIALIDAFLNKSVTMRALFVPNN